MRTVHNYIRDDSPGVMAGAVHLCVEETVLCDGLVTSSTSWKFANVNVLKVDRGAFGLKAEIARARCALVAP